MKKQAGPACPACRQTGGDAGQTLIEVLVALATIVVVVSAITVVSISSLNNAQFERNQSLSVSYAQQGLEIARSMKNNDYPTFRSLLGGYCLAKSCTSISPSAGGACGSNVTCASPNVDTFIRSINIDQNSTDCASVIGGPNPINITKVTATVSWSDGKCTVSNTFCHKTVISTCMSDYNVILRP